MSRERLFAAAACGLFIAVLTLASAQAQAAQAAGELDSASRGPRHVAGLPHLGARDVAAVSPDLRAAGARRVGSRRRADRAAERSRSARPRALSALYAPDRLSLAVRRAERLAGAVRGSPGRGARPQSGAAPPAGRGAATPGSGSAAISGAPGRSCRSGVRSATAAASPAPPRPTLWSEIGKSRSSSSSATGRPADAERELRRPEIAPLVDHVEVDLARCTIARGYLAMGDAPRALTLARRAAARSGRVLPELHWTAGLAAWRAGRIPPGGLALCSAGECRPRPGPARRAGPRGVLGSARIPGGHATRPGQPISAPCGERA